MIIKTENRTDLEKIFSLIANKYGSVWLDSSLKVDNKGTKSFIARNPIGGVKLENNQITIQQFDKKIVLKSDKNIFEYLEQYWQNNNYFSVGYFSYESTFPLLGLKNQKKPIIPDIQFLIYDVVLIYDHISGKFLSSNPDIDNFSDLFETTDISLKNISPNNKTVKAAYTKDEYLRKVEKVKYHIKEGDIYQANFTTGFEIESEQNPFNTYSKLRTLNPAPYSAFLNFGDFQILSSSMERMFKKDHNQLYTCPIKGTIQRGASMTEEKAYLNTLLNSEKDKAELLMIVDLERNDLGKVAKTGSVKVKELFRPEIYSSVIHLVSDITCQIDNDKTVSDIIKAILPGGSITGAPKKRAVEILLELEEIPRNIYTGCVGYVWGEQADFNISIRTILHKKNKYHLHAGGGIVADSDPENEYNEMLLKAKNLFKAIGVEWRT